MAAKLKNYSCTAHLIYRDGHTRFSNPLLTTIVKDSFGSFGSGLSTTVDYVFEADDKLIIGIHTESINASLECIEKWMFNPGIIERVDLYLLLEEVDIRNYLKDEKEG